MTSKDKARLKAAPRLSSWGLKRLFNDGLCLQQGHMLIAVSYDKWYLRESNTAHDWIEIQELQAMLLLQQDEKMAFELFHRLYNLIIERDLDAK